MFFFMCKKFFLCVVIPCVDIIKYLKAGIIGGYKIFVHRGNICNDFLKIHAFSEY